MMKFDLFTALELLNKKVGNNSKITVSNFEDSGIRTTITVYIDGRYLSNSFIILYTEMDEAHINVMNFKFSHLNIL